MYLRSDLFLHIVFGILHKGLLMKYRSSCSASAFGGISWLGKVLVADDLNLAALLIPRTVVDVILPQFKGR